MTLQFELAGAQIDGARDYQEDAFLITHLSDANGNPSALVVVADGMGGHAAGNVASNMAVQAFNKHVSSNYPTDDVSNILHESVQKANHSISETIKETPALQGMGCTMVAAILEGNKLWWASVGDSHLYLIRNKELSKKNADHSYGGFLDRMEAAGNPIEPEAGLSRNMLMSAITGDEINEIDCPAEPVELQEGDRILICSDGMDTLSDGKIIQFSEWSESPKECADALLQAVEDADMPRQDNTTAVVVNVKSGGMEEQPAPVEEKQEFELEEEESEVTAEHYVLEAPTQQPGPTITEPAPAAKEAGLGKSKTGLIAGVAILLVLTVAGGAFVMLGGDDKPAPALVETEEQETVTEEIMETEPPQEVEVVSEEAEAEVIEESEVEEEIPTEVKEEPAPETVSVPQPLGEEFQDELKVGGKGPAMIVIPASSFQMGSTGTSRYTEERPRHTVNVKKFAISKHEITFAEYDRFAKAKGKKLPDDLYMERDTHPVIFVSWDDAYYYTKWLSEQTGHTYRLASEAEWEYAASGGKKSPFWWGYDEEPGKAHCFGCGSGLDPRKPTKVGSFAANALGVHDTAGNVAEWVQDCWHGNYKDAPTDGSVWEGGDCSYRVVRGGAYSSPPTSIRTQKRDRFKSEKTYDHIGIRVVRELK